MRSLPAEMICAHRGASGTTPENTIAAFAAACAMPIGSIEFDISLLGDGRLLVHHDGELGRTIRATGSLMQMAAEDFADLDAGSWFDPGFASERAPLLSTVMQLLGQHDKLPVLDVKIHGDEALLFASALAQELAGNWFADKDVSPAIRPPLVTSFSRPFLTMLRSIDPAVRLGLLDEPLPPDWQAFCDEWQIEAVHLDYAQTSPEDVAAVRASGRDVRLYTVNDPAAIADHVDAGLTAVISDFPERFFM